jgi:hypothetical protein
MSTQALDGRGIAGVALRVWALMLLVDAVGALPGVLLALRATPWPAEQAELIRAEQYAAIVRLVVLGGLAVALLKWADPISRRAIPATAQLEARLTASQLLEVGLALVGVGFLIRGVEQAAVLAYSLPGDRGDAGVIEYLWDARAEGMVAAIVDLLAGLVLSLGRAGLTRAWTWIRGVVGGGGGLTRG